METGSACEIPFFPLTGIVKVKERIFHSILGHALVSQLDSL